MGGITWSKWFWADWRSDPKLRLCGYAARGLWMDLLSLAAEADPPGYVTVDGGPLSAEAIAKLTGGEAREVVGLLVELETKGVASRTQGGVLFSRRIVRDARIREEARINGAKGGNPALGRGTRLPTDWQLPQEWALWAIGDGLSEETVRREGERFCDYWLAQPGQRGCKVDWLRTWRNWVRKEVDRQHEKDRSRSGARDVHSLARAATRAAERRY